MMEYSIQAGVVLTQISDVFLLVADAEGRKKCPYIRRINEEGAFIWKQMEKNRSIKEICDLMSEKYEITFVDSLEEDVNAFIENLRKNHYVI